MESPQDEFAIDMEMPRAADPIITTRPTQVDIDRALRESRMVMVFVKFPKRVAKLVFEAKVSLAIKSVAIEAWADGLMQGWGILPSSYMALFAVKRDMDVGDVIDGYRTAFSRLRYKGIIVPPVQALGVTNLITEATLAAWRDGAWDDLSPRLGHALGRPEEIGDSDKGRS